MKELVSQLGRYRKITSLSDFPSYTISLPNADFRSKKQTGSLVTVSPSLHPATWKQKGGQRGASDSCPKSVVCVNKVRTLKTLISEKIGAYLDFGGWIVF